MHWQVIAGDILDAAADVLVCSANVWLNLSGGVGGAILLRHGPAMQLELHGWLADHGLRHAPPGTIVATRPHGLSVGTVLHVVAVNGLYETTPALVRTCTATALAMAGELGATSVALAALGTGYGRLPIAAFGSALADLDAPLPIQTVSVYVRHPAERDVVAAALRRSGP